MNKLILMRRNMKQSLFVKNFQEKKDIVEKIQDINYIKSIGYTENRVVYCFWTGTNEMSNNRISCLIQMHEKIGVPIVLVTLKNLDYFILKEHLHPSYEYLSETHKSDFLRIYFMHFFGGGYSDIKYPSGSWINSFEKLQNTKELYMIGYDDVSSGEHVHLSSFICKPNTDLTKDWYNEMVKVLDEKLELLKQYPSTGPQSFKTDDNMYPLRWRELLGETFEKVIVKYKDNYDNTLPFPFCHWYR